MNPSLKACAGVLASLCLAQTALGQEDMIYHSPTPAEEPVESEAPAKDTETPAPAAEKPAPATETPAPVAEEQSPATPAASSSKTLAFGPFVAVGVPHPLTAGVDVIYADTIGVSFSAGRSGTEIDSTDIEIRSWDIGVSWFPFGGSFFIGALYGDQGIVGKRTVDLKVDASGIPLTVPTTLRLEITSKYLTPHLGWYARWDSGFSLGFDIGVQLPSSSSSELQTSFANVSAASETYVRNSDDYKKNKKDVEDAAELIGKKAIPYINLIKLGWLF